MLATLRPTFVFLVMMSLVFGVAYPAVVTLVLQGAFPYQAEGSLIRGKNGELLGSELIGQSFDAPGYFWGRPSATGPQPYNAAASTGSNLGTKTPALLEAVQARIAALGAGKGASVPVDLVTASASGLDPHISPAAAAYQIPRIAKARGQSEADIRALVVRFTEPRSFGILGEPRVNVLKLNLSLDHKLDAASFTP